MGTFTRVVAGFVVAVCCTPAGVSGAFVLLPVQLHVFHLPSPAITATNLLYNLVSTPAGALAFHRAGRLDLPLTRLLVTGTTPGVVAGVLARSTWLASEEAFAWVAGTVLLVLGVRLVAGTARPVDRRGGVTTTAPAWRLVAVGTAGGFIGGVYGLGGAAVIVPWLVGVERLPVARVAGAGLVTTLVTSVVGLTAFALASAVGFGAADPPQWANGVALGIGGALGAIVGARLQPRLPTAGLRIALGAIAVASGLRTLL
jgi:uncharacterized protein